ncbi:hypothetical protein KC347_g301 [Hortaea werneckii]|nr:hypothetical protein KC347_g301 [Hortaea werneckii]
MPTRRPQLRIRIPRIVPRIRHVIRDHIQFANALLDVADFRLARGSCCCCCCWRRRSCSPLWLRWRSPVASRALVAGGFGIRVDFLQAFADVFEAVAGLVQEVLDPFPDSLGFAPGAEEGDLVGETGDVGDWNSGSSAYWGSSVRRQVVGCDSRLDESANDMMGRRWYENEAKRRCSKRMVLFDDVQKKLLDQLYGWL